MKTFTQHIKTSSLILLTVFGFTNANAFSQNPTDKKGDEKKSILRTVKHSAFKAGEKLTYRLHYGIIDAGEATLEVKKTSKTVKGRELLHVVGKGRTLGAFNWVFKVRDRYESYIDAEGIFPWMFIRRVNEGGFKINQDYVFKQDKKQVKTQDKKTFETPFGIQDMLSSFYYTRTLDFSKAKINDEYSMNMFIDNEVFPFKIKYLGTETVKTRKGKFDCIKLRPIMMKGRVWESEESMTIWVSNDENKIPILLETEIAVGTIKATLTKWEGLVKPIVKK